MMFKNCMPLAFISLLLTSCSSFNSLLDSRSSSMAKTAATAVERHTFFSNADIGGDARMISLETTKPAASPLAVTTFNYSSIPTTVAAFAATAAEVFAPMQFKYAIMMNETVEKITNISLYSTIDEWLGTRYRYGGTTHRGIDCSAFMQVLGQCVFAWVLPRTAHAQFAIMQKVARADIKEGDFVYFHTTRRGVSHVGMYLQNNKFVHSSCSRGVTISDLDDTYWDSRIIGFKRMKEEEVLSN